MFIKYYKKYIYNLSKTLYRRDLNRVLLLFHNLKPLSVYFLKIYRRTYKKDLFKSQKNN